MIMKLSEMKIYYYNYFKVILNFFLISILIIIDLEENKILKIPIIMISKKDG